MTARPTLTPRQREMLEAACRAPGEVMRRAASLAPPPSKAWTIAGKPFPEQTAEVLRRLGYLAPVIVPGTRATEPVRNERGATLAYRYAPTPAAFARLGR